jgi:hypothetical protein
MLSSGRPRTSLNLVHSERGLQCLSRKEPLALVAICLCTLAVFTNVDAWVDKKPMRIPYVTVVLECGK